MKRYISLILVFTFVLFCFTGCKKYKNAATLDQGDETHYALTEKGGKLSTSPNGDYMEIVTDEYGATHTQIFDLEHQPIIYDNVIYYNEYSIGVPDGWTVSENTSNDAVLVRDSDKTEVKIMRVKSSTDDAKTVDQLYQENVSTYQAMIHSAKESFPDATLTDTTIKIGGKTCALLTVYVPKGADGKPGYIGFIVMKFGDNLMRVMIQSDNNLTGKLDDITAILATINYTN